MACGACGSLLFCQALRLSSKDRRSDGFQSARKRIALVSFLPSLSSRVWLFFHSSPRATLPARRTPNVVVRGPPTKPSSYTVLNRPSDNDPTADRSLVGVAEVDRERVRSGRSGAVRLNLGGSRIK